MNSYLLENTIVKLRLARTADGSSLLLYFVLFLYLLWGFCLFFGVWFVACLLSFFLSSFFLMFLLWFSSVGLSSYFIGEGEFGILM